ncbi:MAG: hypothetical protein AABX88_03115 [Nanoarchaeota archaeon]
MGLKVTGKRGSHVGVMISFSMFIAVMIFLFMISWPVLKPEEKKETTLNYLKTELIKETTATMTSATILLDDTPPFPCIKFSIPQIGITNISVEDGIGKNLDYSTSGANIIFTPSDTSNRFYKIHHSTEFGTKNSGATCDTSTTYQIMAVKKDNYVFESKIVKLIQDYQEDYDLVRSRFNIPSKDDFSFSFSRVNGTVSGTGQQNIRANVYVREIQVIYVGLDSSINPGTITIEVW